MAAYNGHVEAMRLLLEHGAEVDARTMDRVRERVALFHLCTMLVLALLTACVP